MLLQWGWKIIFKLLFTVKNFFLCLAMAQRKKLISLLFLAVIKFELAFFAKRGGFYNIVVLKEICIIVSKYIRSANILLIYVLDFAEQTVATLQLIFI